MAMRGGIASVRAIIGRIFLVLMLASGPVPALARPALSHLTLVVPGAVGGGWDLTAKAMKRALEQEHLVNSVAIERYPGTGGLVGLSQFVANYRGRGDVLLVGGLTLLGSTISDEAAISIRDVTPIARLTGDWGLIAVRADSPIRSIADLRHAMLDRSNGLRWSGGALGSPDQATVWAMASQIGVPLDDVLYYGKVGGRRAADALMEGRVDVAISGYAEFNDLIQRGQIRPIAVSAPRRLAGSDVPTLREGGIDVSIMNWRGIFAAPGLSMGEQQGLTDLLGAMHKSAAWQDSLSQARWTDAYLDQAGFSRFLGREQARWPNLINPPQRRGLNAVAVSGSMLGSPLALLLASAVLAVGLFVLLRMKRLKDRALVQAETGEQRQDRGVWVDAGAMDAVKSGIMDDFSQWALSGAERDVAWFMLRGLPFRDIAGLRGTSERTVRQQAQAIYRKAGLEGRSDLAGRVLERFI